MKNYDVMVAGAGPSGIAAALSAAGNGAKVLLAERSGFVGGMSTDGLLNIFCGTASSALFDEILSNLAVCKTGRWVYDVEELKDFYFRRLTGAGVDLLFNAQLIGCRTDGAKPSPSGLLRSVISSVTLAGAAGAVVEISAKVYIDATGDGALAFLAGVPYIVGREEDGRTEPISLMVRLGGVDDTAAVYPTFGTHPELEKRAAEAVRGGKIIPPAGHVILIPEKRPGMASMNMTNATGLLGSDPWERTSAELLCRKQLPGVMRFLRGEVPGYRDAYIVSTAVYAGVRETRRFSGDYRLTKKDVAGGEKFEDWCVSRVNAAYGGHNPDGSGMASDNGAVKGSYTVPYRSLLPLGVSNMLLAGRCICGDHVAHSSYRVMPVCMAIGQAAGTAAALSLGENGDVRAVDVKVMQNTLTAQGVLSPV